MYRFIGIICFCCLALPLVAQTCKFDSIVRSTPPGTFRDNGDGTVTDTRYGLIWKRCVEGQTWNGSTCTGTAASYTWGQALALADNATFVGRSDWRLPNLKELTSIVEEACYDPAIDLAVFPNTQSEWFWSASPDAYYADYAWIVNILNGNDNDGNRTNTGRARLVCAGQ